MLVIGILGSRGKSKVLEIIHDELKKHGKEIVCIGTHDNSNEAFEKILFKEVEYVLIAISREDLIEDRISKIKFDVIINLGFDAMEGLYDKIANVVENIKEEGYYIFNSDSNNLINFSHSNIYVISYGLNNKSTVTATSIDDLTCLCFSFCLQRAIVNINGDLIQPFEKPYEVLGKYHDVYYYLAALTCLIIFGII